MLLEFIIWFIVVGFASYGLHQLYLYATHPERIFGFVQNWIRKLEARKQTFFVDYLHKSLGSCAFCNRQRFADFGFILLILTHTDIFGSGLKAVLIWVLLFTLFSGYVVGIAIFKDSISMKKRGKEKILKVNKKIKK